MLYAKINPDNTDSGQRRRDIDPVPLADLPPGKPYWVPVTEVVNDTSTGAGQPVPEAPVTELLSDGEHVTEVRITRTIRDLTSGELDAQDTAAIEHSISSAGITRALLGWAFDAENRLRALEGQPAVTLDQFKAAVKAKIRG